MDTVGSRAALGPAEFAAGWQRLQGVCDDMRSRLGTASNIKEATRAFSWLAHARALSIVTSYGGRGTRLERLTWYALYAVVHLIFVLDKRTDPYSDLRAIPVHALLREQLDAWLADLDALVAACSRLGIRIDHGGRRIDERTAARTALFGAVVVDNGTSPTLRRMRLSRRRLRVCARIAFSRPDNVGRHTVLSHGVQHGWDPWLLKMLSGHHRGDAEPFADGSMVSPRHGLAALRERLDEWAAHLLRGPTPSKARWVLPLDRLPARLPSPPQAGQHSYGMRSRVLSPPWQTLSPSALRVIGHVRHRVAALDGPSHAGANLLLAMMLLDLLPLTDAQAVWTTPRAVFGLGTMAVVLWQRDARSQELHRPMDDRVVIALERAVTQDAGALPPWSQCRDHAASWLRANLAWLDWPGSNDACLRAFDVMAGTWRRAELPPFLLAASSPRLPAAAASRRSLLRLFAPERQPDATERLIAPVPRLRGPNRVRVKQSPLAEVLARIHYRGKRDKRLGEDFARWADLVKDVAAIDVASDSRARAIAKVLRFEKSRWTPDDDDQPRFPRDGRVQVSSMSTYMYSIGPDLDRISPSDEIESWQEEWIDWLDGVRRASVATKERTRDEVLKSRMDAARHLLRSLRAVGYTVPDEAFESGYGEAVARGSRRAAASTVLFAYDRRRIGALVDVHFADTGLGRERASLYELLSTDATLRAGELAALEVDALNEFAELAVHSVGFSHIKSPHGWRLQPLPEECAARYRRTGALIREADPKARWIFLDGDPNDHSRVNELAAVYSVAIRQVTGETDARPHAARAVAPLERILPGWESICRELVRGDASVARCREFIHRIESQGVAHLVHQLVPTGHGHPVTYLTYYFAVWSWVLAIYARALNADLADADEVARRILGPARAAYRKGKQRAGRDFGGWAWLRKRAVASLDVPPLQAPEAPASEVDASALKPPAGAHGDAEPADTTRAVRYVAARFMGLSGVAAAHLFAIASSRAAALEAKFDDGVGGVLRSRHQGVDGGRGRQAELRLLRGDVGQAIAARLVVCPLDNVCRLDAWLDPKRRSPHSVMRLDALIDDLLRCAAVLPSSLGLWVQPGVDRYGPDELDRLAKLGQRVVAGAPDRDVGNLPRIGVVDASQPANRVRRARLTALARCLIAAALIVRKGHL